MSIAADPQHGDGARPADQANGCAPRGVGSAVATRRRFLAGTVGTAAAVAFVGMHAAPAGAHDIAAGTGTADGTEGPDGTETGDATGAAAEREPTAAVEERATTREVTLPAYVSRRDWGANESWRRSEDGDAAFPVAFAGVQKITVHHTATMTPWSSDAAADLVREIYHEHCVELGFGDIGYHLLIDPEGVVYEGRYSGGTRFPVYDVRPAEGVPDAVVAAHTKGYNVGNIGIALIGDLDEIGISDAAWWSLVTTIALICRNTGLDPLGRDEYVNPVNGNVIVAPNVGGHRHYAETTCPGEALMGWMSDLRSEVAAAVSQLPRRAWLA